MSTHDSSGTATGRSWQWAGPYTLEAVREASIGARAFLQSCGLPEDHLSGWELVLAEAGNNCVLHPGDRPPPGLLEISLLVAAGQVTARLLDRTPGFDWPDDPGLPDDDSESGRGLFLIEALTDSRIYARGKHGNFLELRRSFPDPGPPEDLEATLEAMTEELSTCYESLSAIFRFTAEARDADSPRDFAGHVLEHLITLTSAEIGILRVADHGRLVCLALHGVEEGDPLPMETRALESRRDQWFEGPESASLPDTVRTGLVHPFFHDDEPLGVLTLARTSSDEPFNAGELNLVHTFAEFLSQHFLSLRHEEEAIRSRLARHEFDLAAAIQQSLLPPVQDPVEGIHAIGHCESALSIGGDFYDLIPMEGTGYFFVIADVMGKGVAASMMAAVTRSIIRSLGEDFDHPATVLEKVGSQMFEDLDRLEMFVTLAVGVVDVPAGLIRVANAGHCPVVISGNELAEAMPEAPPIGIERSPSFQEDVIPLHPGTRILAYTDGFIDPRNERPVFETQDEVAAWFHQSAGTVDPVILKQQLLQRLGQTGSAESLADDQTFLILTF
ncbi:SpoIIE family protein phosphatase [Haloferula sargassicola]|uniref:PPM-type phosphatase domain-containing protein n=1 Tax=Haloferula sargassicola TaxID=490096 RepID=A0ABP9URS6_9BACT